MAELRQTGFKNFFFFPYRPLQPGSGGGEQPGRRRRKNKIKPLWVEVKTSRVPQHLHLTGPGRFPGGALARRWFCCILLALRSGDLFLQKLVRVMPHLAATRRARLKISREIQQKHFPIILFSVSLINLWPGPAS